MKCDRSLYEQMEYIMNACTIAHVHVQLKLDTCTCISNTCTHSSNSHFLINLLVVQPSDPVIFCLIIDIFRLPNKGECH